MPEGDASAPGQDALKRYVLGFMFDEGGQRVLLIEKRRPAWQAGRLNGIGGKIELGETPLEAMRLLTEGEGSAEKEEPRR